MTGISFYILKQPGEMAGLQFACRLTEKAFGEGHSIYLHAADEASCAQADTLLWTFRQGSFVPHARYEHADTDHADTPVMIGTIPPPARLDDVLINLSNEVPAFFSRFQRAIEIVTPDNKDAARQRYKFYQDRGYEIETHNIS